MIGPPVLVEEQLCNAGRLVVEWWDPEYATAGRFGAVRIQVEENQDIFIPNHYAPQEAETQENKDSYLKMVHGHGIFGSFQN